MTDSIFPRRQFLKTTAAASLGTAILGSRLPGARTASDTIRIGIIGCGGRGAHDGGNCLKSAPGVELVAMGDLFADNLENCHAKLKKQYPDQVKVTPEMRFSGWDAFKKVLATDIDLVILTEPPHFRAEHLRAAVEAGKHAFVEKPVAVDPVGVRHVIESAELAAKKNLTIVAGTQARRMRDRQEIIKRIRDGAIGDIVSGQCVRMGGAMGGWGIQKRPASMSDMEWQIRRWLFQDWLSGDFIAEMHVHELDVTNWLVGSTPEKCTLLGSRSVRTGPMYGNVFDNFSGQFEYPGGVVISYMGCQIDGCSGKTFERIQGTKGTAYSSWSRSYLTGPNAYEYKGPAPQPDVQQHTDQIAAIRGNETLNEGRRIAESSLAAIMGRMSAYTARELSWKWAMNASKLDLTPPHYKLGPLDQRPVSVPGKTPLV